jgi:Xaa-Pro aminopeptidase
VSAFAARRGRLREVLAGAGLDALVISHLPNVRYLTGYVGSNAIAVIGRAGERVVTDSRYAVSAREQVDDELEVTIGPGDLTGDLAEAVAAIAPGGRVGLEAAHVSMARGAQITARIGDADAAVVVTAEVGHVEGLRLIKDDQEIAAIARAADMADAALADVLAAGLVGRSEREVAFALQTRLFEAGAEGPSFEIIVAGGANGAKPHAVPGPRVIGAGELVVIDLGAIADGYCSDMTRTVPTGPLPAALARAYEVCAEAQAAALAAVRPGIGCAALDAVARDLITAAGLGEAFGHGLGHGVGLEIHEAPRLSREGTETLRPGMVVTIEPGIYLQGLGGVRIEDLVVVTDDGARVLSHSPKASVSSATV